MTDLEGPLPGGEPPDPDFARAKGRIWGFWASVFWGLGAVLVLGAGQLAGALIYLLIYNSGHPRQPLPFRDIPTNGPLIAVAMLIAVPALIAYLAFAIRRAHSTLQDYLALRQPRLRDVGIGIGGLVAVLIVVSIFATLGGVETPGFMTGTYETGRAAGLLPLLAVAFVVAAPIGEEALFRGFLYRGFAHALGAPIAILLTAVSWALLHIQYDAFFIVEIVTLGIFFGWLRWLSGSTLLTMMIHGLNNGLAMVALAVGVQ